jgi:hypothetical protein
MNMGSIVLPELQSGATGTTGQMDMSQVADLQKALEMGNSVTDVANLSGGSALRIQSLDRTMMSTIQEHEDFALFNELVKSNAGATVDEWTEQSGIGGFLGGSTNSETGNIEAATGQYNRRVGSVKYLMTRREVSFVATLGNNLAEAESVEQSNGALQLLTDAEYLSFEGDAAVVPTEFDGIYAQMAAGVASGQISSDHVIDMDGASLSDITAISKAAQTIRGYGNFGRATHIFVPTSVQTDLDLNLQPAYRVGLANVPAGGIEQGAPVVGIRTSFGDIKTKPDVFIPDEQLQRPFQLDFPTVAAANAFTPAAVAVDAAVNSAQSRFTAPRAGNYYYLVCGVNAKGQSVGVLTNQVAVAAGKKVTLTIDRSVSGAETGYVIYRSRLNGTNALSDLRRMTRIPSTGASTVYVDNNLELPGTVKSYVLNLKSGANAINWRQLLPMMRFNLYPTVSATVPWAQLLFGYLRLAKRKQHAVIKNIVPSTANWKPFN